MSCILDALQIRAAGVSKDYDSVGVSVSFLGFGQVHHSLHKIQMCIITNKQTNE